MSYGFNSNKFLIKEGTIQVGTWTTPHLIGTNNTDPLQYFSGNVLGYFKQGTLKPMLNRNFAEFLANTPGILVRKDLIRKQFHFDLELAQFNADTLALAMGTYQIAGYSITTPTIKTVDLNFFGSDQPVQNPLGYLITTATVDGKAFYMAGWSMVNTSEDVSPTLSGTAHATIKCKFEAFPSLDFAGLPTENQQHYGLYWDEL